MSDLMDSAVRAEVARRVDSLTPDSVRKWGRMSVGGMVVHLRDAFELVMGERPVARTPRWHERTLLRWVALHLPLQWPKGYRSTREVDQEIGGSPPDKFGRDVERLKAIMERFATEIDPATDAHPFFGRLTREEWGRWGYRHMDHHLRQFSA